MSSNKLIVDFSWNKQGPRRKEGSVEDSTDATTAILPEKAIEEAMEDDPIDAISDISTDSIQESPNTKSLSKIQFKDPKSIRDYAAKVRKIERKIMLGLLTDPEEAKLRKSKFFSTRFEQLLNLSRTSKKSNLYKLVTWICLNDMMMTEMQRKIDASPANLRKKLQVKVNSLKAREKAVQEKIASSSLSPNDVNNFLRDMYFIVKFGEDLSLDHNSIFKADQVGVTEQSGDMICDYCQSTVEKNRFGQREELLICKDCGNKAHPSCLSYSSELVQQIRADDSWQCIDCKACVLCNGTGDPDTLLFCDACDKGYHMQCHTPKLDKMPSGKWACASCLSKGKSVMAPVGNKQPVFIIEDDEKEVATTVAEQKTKPERNRTPVAPLIQKVDQQHVISNIPPVVQPTRPVMIPQPGLIYHPPGMAYGQIPVTTPVTLPPGHHVPVQLPGNQPHLIPVNYVVPNGTALPTPHPAHVLGKGAQNDLTHILNPKLPLPAMVNILDGSASPRGGEEIRIFQKQGRNKLICKKTDVRSTIREDVLRALAPDVADWNVRDVSYYFKSHGYMLESKLLEEQEIDGRAMLLMSRNDVLTGLRIKLGPALKIYHMHIHKLQKRTDFLG